MEATKSSIVAIALCALFIVAGLWACAEKSEKTAPKNAVAMKPVDLTDLNSPPTEQNKISEIVYVPAYSSIYQQDGDRLCDLTITLSVHNINFDQTMTLENVVYVNTQGKPIRSYVDSPLVLAPMETRQFVIHERDRSGGSGANFLVKWEAESNVKGPIIEAVMISTTSQQGISFVTQGKVIKRFPAEKLPPPLQETP